MSQPKKTWGLEGKQLTPYEVAELAHRHGIPLDKLETAVAVAWGESNYFTGAWNEMPETNDGSYGLYQINMLGHLEGERLKEYGLKNRGELFDADKNAAIMVKMSNGGKNWRPWGAFTNGSYQRGLKSGEVARAVKAVAEGTGEPPWDPFPGKNLRPGVTDASVGRLRTALKAAGYLDKKLPDSNYYGAFTQEAVAKFHHRHPEFASKGVDPDPAIGPKGWAQLMREERAA